MKFKPLLALNYFNYFTEIEEAFIRRRKRHLSLSPLDWALIEAWKKRGIPLRVVLKSINKVFDILDEYPNQLKSIKSLLYCNNEIESQYREWLDINIGKAKKDEINAAQERDNKSSLRLNQAVEKHLANIICELEKSKAKNSGELRKTLELVLKKLNLKEKDSTDLDSFESELELMEKDINQALLKNCDKKSLTRIRGEIEHSLKDYKAKIARDVYENIFDLMLYKRLREGSGIPRLSMFNL